MTGYGVVFTCGQKCEMSKTVDSMQSRRQKVENLKIPYK